ncbi:hypothetical protein ABZW96_36060 [Nocardia sp. NPDC004168]|uniref:hypothetical protein n=1 Tax=Nocardia sp. NPDC004168 TaxID=3154452 RepID=UPI0033B7243A
MFVINIPFDGLEVDARSPQLYVSGKTWITLDGYDFPANGWFDSPLSFLGSLRHAIARAADGEDEADFYFWEGSYFVKLVPGPTHEGQRCVEIFAVDDGRAEDVFADGGSVEASCVCPLGELARVFQGVVSELTGWAQERREVELLEFLARITDLPGLE